MPILWRATHESGDYSEWDLGGFGGDFSSGPGTFAKSIDGTRAHTGTYSLKMQTDTTLGQAGQRNFRWAVDAIGTDLPVRAVYTAYYYFDQQYQPLGGDWNIMQWKTKRDAVGTNDPDWAVNVYNPTGTAMQIYLFDFHTGSNHGSFSPAGSLTINTWHKIEVDYTYDTGTNGAISASLDDTPFYTVSGLVTQWPSSETARFRHWSVNNYTSKNTPDASTIWVDDVTIASLDKQRKAGSWTISSR